MMGPIPEGDRFADVLKFRRLGIGGGDVLYECWGDAVRAYAAQEVAAERERWECLARQALEVMENHRSEHAQSLITGVVNALRAQLDRLTTPCPFARPKNRQRVSPRRSA
jgi:hypothetical protein